MREEGTYTKHPAICKFCGNALQIEVHDECEGHRLAKWIPMAACDRCADFRRTVRKLYDTGARLSLMLIREVKKDVVEPHLVDLTKRFSAMVCEHFGLDYEWNEDIVKQILEEPTTCTLAMGYFEAQMKRKKRRLGQRNIAAFI